MTRERPTRERIQHGHRSAFLLMMLAAVGIGAWAPSPVRAQETPQQLMAPAASTSQPVALSLRKAVQIATQPEGNARIRLAVEGVREARARSAEVRAALLP